MGRWFLGCPASQSGPGKDGFLIDVSMVSQSSFSRSLLAASRCHRNVDQETGLIRGTPEKPSAHFTTAKTYVGT